MTTSVSCCQGPAGEIGPPGQQGNPGVQVRVHPIHLFKSYRHASDVHNHLQAYICIRTFPLSHTWTPFLSVSVFLAWNYPVSGDFCVCTSTEGILALPLV